MAATQAGIELESMAYESDSDSYRFTFDPERTPPSMAVVAALSSALDVAAMDLDPIYEMVDTDALDALVRVQDQSIGDVTVSISHASYTLTVHSYGLVTMVPTDGEETTDWAESSLDQ
jgi:hypothetical protein